MFSCFLFRWFCFLAGLTFFVWSGFLSRSKRLFLFRRVSSDAGSKCRTRFHTKLPKVSVRAWKIVTGEQRRPNASLNNAGLEHCKTLEPYFTGCEVCRNLVGFTNRPTGEFEGGKSGNFLTDKRDTALSQTVAGPGLLTFFTYLTLLSNTITRFNPNALNGAHLLKVQNWNSYSLEWLKKIKFAAINGSVHSPLWKVKFTPG